MFFFFFVRQMSHTPRQRDQSNRYMRRVWVSEFEYLRMLLFLTWWCTVFNNYISTIGEVAKRCSTSTCAVHWPWFGKYTCNIDNSEYLNNCPSLLYSVNCYFVGHTVWFMQHYIPNWRRGNSSSGRVCQAAGTRLPNVPQTSKICGITGETCITLSTWTCPRQCSGLPWLCNVL